MTVLLGLALVALSVTGCDDGDEGRAAKPDQPSPSQSTSNGVVSWPAPPDPLKRTVGAGLKPGVKEFHINHVHAYLEIYVDGLPVTVPAGIGINIKDPEALGEFFTKWGVRLDESCLADYCSPPRRPTSRSRSAEK